MASRRSVIRSLILCAGPALSALGAGAANAANELAEAAARSSFGSGGARIGLLLPPRQGPFGRAALAVQLGVEAAVQRASRDLRLEIIEIEDEPTSIADAYKRLGERGVAIVLGPLTRSGVTTLAMLPSVPYATLAMNYPDDGVALPERVIVFGLAIETEARQVSQLAWEALRARGIVAFRTPRAVVLAAGTPLARRGAAAFHEAWRARGAEATLPIEVDTTPLPELRERIAQVQPEVAFLAMGPEQAREYRPLFGERVLVHATSQASIGGLAPMLKYPELDGLRVVDMPWMIQPEHLAVLAYPRPAVPLNIELQRLYAFGIDAMRVGIELIGGFDAFALDGVTGALRFAPSAGPRIERDAVPAEYRGGLPVALERS